jgi:molybdenum cofactor guanylyltransferase
VNPAICGLVLAGGQGRRMGGVDKGLQLLRGRPMVEHVLERLRPQVLEVLINANQNAERYGAYGCAVVPDAVGGFAGPLAGLHAGMKSTQCPLILTVPCDSPFLPLDLAARLHAALDAEQADIAVAKTHEQVHPVFVLVRTALLPHLEAYLAGGDRKMDLWYSSLNLVAVPFDDQEAAFSNINTPQDLARHETP